MKQAAIILALGLAACSPVVTESRQGPPPIVEFETATTAIPATTTTEVPDVIDRRLVLVYGESGGCMMMGPNCATHRLWSDGTIEVLRSATGPDGGTVEQSGAINVAIPDKIQALAGDVDFDALLAGLPPGSCQGCVDGIDVTLEIYGGQAQLAAIDSVTHEIPWDHPLFAAIVLAREQMGEQLELPVISR